MLDFVKAMEIARRLCKEFADCKYCPLRSVAGGIGCAIAADQTGDISETERRLIEWDKAHPEPQYPTWEEWIKDNFPDTTIPLPPCCFIKCELSKECNPNIECLCWEIPADIAKKLGIQPKEVTP